MKPKISRAVLCMAVLFISVYMCLTANAATKKNTDKYYELSNFRLSYDATTGQVKAQWSPTQKDTDKVVTLYKDGVEIANVTISGMSVDFTDEIANHGTGVYRCKAYPEKLGKDKTVSSRELTITEAKLKKSMEFDSGVYTLESALLFYDEKTQKILATWQFSDKKSAVRLQLLRGATVVDDWVSCSDLSYDYSDVISKKGAGTYVLRIFPERLGDTYGIESNDYEVTSDMSKNVKATIKAEEKAEESTRIGWFHDGPTNIWRYYPKAGVMLKRDWLDYNGKRYHFSSTGIMQIGWQVIDSKYYYFDNAGALVTNSAIGGYPVNANGERIDATGAVVSAAGEKEAPAITTPLLTCNIRVTETGKEANVVKNASFTASTGFKIESVTMAQEYPNWTAGVPVKVTIVVNADTNYYFASGIKFTVSGCKNVSSTGGTTKRTVTCSYYPKKNLATPEYIYINGNNELCWKKVPDAYQYKITVTTADGTKKTYPETGELTEPQFSLSDYYEPGFTKDEFSVTITSVAANKKTTYFKSSSFTIEKMTEFAKTYSIDGYLKFYTAGIRCYDMSGNMITGWKQMFGNWYYFKKGGYSATGWLKDENDLWYYFDQNYRMCTGTINDGTGEYFLNDGSVTNLPLGAWVKP